MTTRNNTTPKEVFPGFHKDFPLEQFRLKEKAILKAMAKIFYITRKGGQITIGASNYSHLLLKPTSYFREMFNLDREIICVFSDYKNFEPRTLEVFDEALKKYQALRTESVCRVLVSDDNEIETTLEAIIKSDPEQPIIIPFTFNELYKDGNPEIIHRRFRKQLFSRNLFSLNSPLQKDLYFFGRTETIQEIIAQHDASENTGLFGLRKSGKTSILYGIERNLRARKRQCIIIDCQSPSIHKLKWNELLHKVVSLVHQSKESKIKISSQDDYTEKNAADLFESDMIKLYDSKKHQSTLIAFDEIERITPNTASSDHWRDGSDFIYFWQTMRAFFQRNRSIFTYMLVGTNPTCIEKSKFNNQDNPIFSQLSFQYVTPFDFAKTKQMVTSLGSFMGMQFDDAIIAKLNEDFGGHPFLIRYACSAMHQKCKGNRPANVDRALYDISTENFINDSGEYLQMILDVLEEFYSDEHEMLRYLALGDMQSFNELSELSPTYTTHLIGYGLISKGSHGYTFNVECIKDFLQIKNKYKKINIDENEKRAEVSERRSNLEQGLRKIIRNQLKSAHGEKKATSKVLEAIPTPRRESLTHLEYKDLMSISSSKLFFLDLINILDREWETFKNIFPFEKQKSKIMLEEINKNRQDAHSNSVQSFEELRIYFTKFEDAIDEWL